MDDRTLRRLKLSRKQAEYVVASWSTTSVAEMARKLKMTDPVVRRIARVLNLGPRPKPDEGSPFDPSPEQIKQRAEEIRAKWTPAEMRLRASACDRRKRWTLPTIRIGEIEPPSYARI